MGNYNVGVNLVEGTGVSPISGISTAISAIIGNFERGPLNKATLVTSQAQFENTFGTKVPKGTTSWYSVKAFFKKAGSAPLYIVRVASSSAAKAALTLLDSGASSTIKIEALSEGTWGNNISVEVLAYNIVSTVPSSDISSGATSAVLNTVEGLEVGSDIKFDDGVNQEYRRLLSVNSANNTITWSSGLTNGYTAAGSTVKSQEFKLKVYVNGVLSEEHNGLGCNADTTFYVEKALISNYVKGSFIKATPDNDYQDLPATLSVTSLTSGADGLSDVVGTDYSGSSSVKTGVYALDSVSNLFRFCCPNPKLTDADTDTAYKALVQALLDYANARVTIEYYADPPYNKSVTDTVTWSSNFSGRRIAVFWPWLKVVESKLNKWLPPSSFVIGAAVEKDYRRGVFKNIGNELVPYAIDLEYDVSIAEGEVLNNANVNTIRKFTGIGIVIYGGRTLSPVTAWRFLHYSELWNYIGKSLAIATKNVPFEPNDSFLWKSVIRRINAFLSNEQLKGALYDASNPTGIPYSVVMDETNNPPDQVALGIANVRVEYVPVGTAEKFVIELTSSPSGLTINS